MGHVRGRVARNCRGCSWPANRVCTLAAICLSRTRAYGIGRVRCTHTHTCVCTRAPSSPRQCCTRNAKVCLRLDTLRDTEGSRETRVLAFHRYSAFKASGPIKPSPEISTDQIYARTLVISKYLTAASLATLRGTGTLCLLQGRFIVEGRSAPCTSHGRCT